MCLLKIINGKYVKKRPCRGVLIILSGNCILLVEINTYIKASIFNAESTHIFRNLAKKLY